MLCYFFEIQNNIQLYHWSCTSFSRHKASDQLYSSLIKLLDKFVEVYSGKYGRPKFSGKIQVKHLNDTEIVDYLKKINKYFIKDIKLDNDTDLLNIRDEILAAINQTLYLFTLS
jgi:hypothetical protein